MSGKIEHTASYLKRQLREAADPEFRRSQTRFFREPVRVLGVRTAEVRRISTAVAKQYTAARLEFDQILDIADQLWTTGAVEERILAVLMLGKFGSQLEPSHWQHLDGWVDSLTNWAETDALCSELLAPLLKKRTSQVKQLASWTRSRNRWRRRAAAVALVPLARQGDQHEAAIAICDRLADDRDDMVEKAIGWLLKEVSRTQPRRVADFLLQNIQRLSRTTIRYACEKLPVNLRAKVMEA